MENSPLPVESKAEKPSDDKTEKSDKEKDSSSKKRKKAGEFLIKAETKREAPKREEKKEPEPGSIWEKIGKRPEEVEPAPEEEAPADGTLGQEERPEATRLVAHARAEVIPEHDDEEELTPEVAEDLVARAFLHETAETGDIEAAAAQVYATMEASPEEIAEAQAAIFAGQQPVEAGLPSEDHEQIVFDRAAEEEPDAADPAGGAGAGGHGGRGAPPRSPFGAPFGAGPVPPDGRQPIPTQSGNLYNTPITSESPYVERYDQGNPAVTALIGGIIGYFIGRRRGRIKAEKQAAKVQKKLEKQIEDINWQLRTKEQQIRRVAAEKVRSGQVFIIEAAAGKKLAEAKPAVPLPKIERRRAPEAGQLHGSARHERIGRVLLATEAPAADKQEVKSELPEHLRQRHVETLNRPELLALSEKIIIDGTSLKQIYETHLIGERGLRRLVDEYLKGGEVKKLLRQEIVEHEIDFERDPAMRDVPPVGGSAASGPTHADPATLDKLVEKASAGLGDNANAAAYYKARAAYEQQERLDQQNRRQIVDIGLAVVITVLLALVVVLYLTRG